jgi:type II restriction/modification system DNA methylase subunit YeeA
VNDGAAVRVSLVGFGQREGARLDGQCVETIHADLSAVQGLDLTKAKRLSENVNAAFIGPQKDGPLDIPGELAREWLKSPNPHGKKNAEVVKPRFNGMDLMRRSSDSWIIDFGTSTPQEEAALYEKPFAHVLQHVKPLRDKNRDNNRQVNWWRFGRSGEDMRTAMAGSPRYIVTPRVAKHRVFVFLNCTVMPDSAVVAVARDDDTTFGILSSRFHTLWSLRLCTWLGVGNDPRYTPTTTFETFPFPEGLTPKDKAENPAISEAAQQLNTLRENWLNPPQWVDWVITPEEEAAGFPMRPVAKPGHEKDVKSRTLTNLYNQRPAWLNMAHRALDAAVAAAYGWTDYTPDMTDEEILRRLLALNLGRCV